MASPSKSVKQSVDLGVGTGQFAVPMDVAVRVAWLMEHVSQSKAENPALLLVVCIRAMFQLALVRIAAPKWQGALA